VKHLPIRQLAMEEALTFAKQLSGSSEASESLRLQHLVEEAGGHPLFIQELVRHAARGGTSGSPRLGDTLRARIGELPEPALRLLRLCSIMGSSLPFSTLARASEMDHDNLARSVARLRANYLLRASVSGHDRESGARKVRAVEPYHDRIREVVAFDL